MQRYDVIVIGGGLTGCAAAYYLARGGAHVCVLESSDVNCGASGRNAGSLHFQLEHREVIHGAALPESLGARVALSRLAIDHWRGLPAELAEDIELHMSGGLMLAESDEEISLLRKKISVEQRHGLSSELLTGAEVRSLAPYLSDRIRAANFCAEEGHCNPRLLTPAFAKQATRRGATIQTNMSVVAIRRRDRQWQVDVARVTPAGMPEMQRLRTDAILNAAGAAAGEIAALANYHLPIFPVGLLMAVTEKTAPAMRHLIQHIGKRISMKQTDSGNLLIGGGWSVRMSHGPNAGGPRYMPGSPSWRALSQSMQVATHVVPGLVDTYIVRTWSGIAGVTADQLPLLGEVPGSGGLFVAAGGSGFTFGPLYAKLISEQMLTGTSTADVAAYSPARFGHINMFMG